MPSRYIVIQGNHFCILILFAIISLCPDYSFSQATYQKIIGESGFYSRGNSIQQLEDKGFIIAGRAVNFGKGGIQAYLIKTDALGNTIWTKMYGGQGSEEVYEIQITSDKGFIMCGYTNSKGTHGGRDVYLIKTNEKGDTLWTKKYGGDRIDGGLSVKQTSDGGYIMTGETYSFGEGSVNAYLVKVDKDGNMMWNRVYGGNGIEDGKSVCQTEDGGYIITGKTNSFGAGDYDVYLIKTDALGKKQWMRTFGGSGSEKGFSVDVAKDGGYIIAGITQSFGAGGTDVYIIKTNKSGDEEWTLTFGGKNDDIGQSVRTTSDGGYIISGYTNSYGGGVEVYLLRIDQVGHIQWTKSYGQDSDDYGNNVCITKDNGYAIVGMTVSAGAVGEKIEKTKNVYLIKTDNSGNISKSSGNVREIKQ